MIRWEPPSTPVDQSSPRVTSIRIEASANQAVQPNIPRNATVPTEAIPSATPSQPSYPGSPPRSAASEAGTAITVAPIPAAPSRNQPRSS